jgi:hypothetical protein
VITIRADLKRSIPNSMNSPEKTLLLRRIIVGNDKGFSPLQRAESGV